MIRLDPNGLYTSAEVAKLIGRNTRTVRRAARRLGKKPRMVYFSAAEVKTILGVR